MTHDQQRDEQLQGRPEWRQPTVDIYAIANTTALGKQGSGFDGDTFENNFSPD